MIYLWQCDRRQFVDFISSRMPLPLNCVRHSESLDNISVYGDEVVLVWRKSPMEGFSIPRVAIVQEEKVQDFLAWVSTYLRSIRPFTGYCRVESPVTAKLAATSELIDWPSDIQSADLGLIVTEAIAYSVGHRDVGRLPFSAFTRPLSFTYAKAIRTFDIAMTGDSQYLSNIEEGWSLCRELSGQPPLNMSPKDVTDVWRLVLRTNSRSKSRDSVISELLTEIREIGQISHKSWLKLVPKASDGDMLWQAMKGPREGRVLAVENASKVLMHGTKATHRKRAFAAGYLASRVQPGTLDHLSLLFPFVSELRESLLWFGVCAGLSPETTVDNYGNGLGWLMRRELERRTDWLERPTCDIALSELKIQFQTGDDRRPTFQTRTSGHLEVEIFPLLTTNVRWVNRSEEHIQLSKQVESQQSLFKNEDKLDFEVKEILRRIDDNSMSLEAIRSHVERTFDIQKAKNHKHRK